MHKTFAELGFKAGDIVKCVNSQNKRCYEVGDTLTLIEKHDTICALYKSDGFLTGDDGEWELVKSAKEDKQMSKWTSTKTEVVTKEVKVINKVVDGSLPNLARISIVPDWGGVVNIVVGAKYEDRIACSFAKDSLKELINVLTEVHDTMEGK